MRINVTVDFSEMFTGSPTVSEWVESIIKEDIRRQLKKSDVYKEYISRHTQDMLDKIKVVGAD